MSNNNVRKTYIIPQGMVDRINELKEYLMYKSEVQVVLQALQEFYVNKIKQTPAYAVAKLRSVEMASRTPEEKALEKIEIEEAKIKAKEIKDARDLQIKIETGKKLCKLLGGKINPDSKGVDRCEYHRGSFINPQNANITHEIEYMDDLKQSDVDFQFFNGITGAKVSKQDVIDALKTSDEVWPE